MKQLEEKNSQIPQVKANNGNSSYSKNGHLLAVTFSKIANNLEDVMFVKHDINPREEWVLEKPDYFTAWVRTKEEGNIKIEAKTFDLVIATAKDLSKKYNKNILIYAVRDQSDSCYGTYRREE